VQFDGNYETRVSVDGKDELADLGRSINETIGKIAAYTRELERLSDEERRGRVGEYLLFYRAALIVEGQKALADG
jgi:hypothetical protein